MYEKKYAQFAEIISRVIRDFFHENMRKVEFEEDESPWPGEIQHFNGITDPGTEFSGDLLLGEDETTHLIKTIKIQVGRREGSFEYYQGLDAIKLIAY